MVTIVGIPTCGTVKKTEKFLKAHGIDFSSRSLKAQPATKTEVKKWVKALGFKPMRNTSGGSYRALGDEKETWGDTEWIAAFSEDSMLLKRPILLIDGEAKSVGFKEDEYRNIFKV